MEVCNSPWQLGSEFKPVLPSSVLYIIYSVVLIFATHLNYLIAMPVGYVWKKMILEKTVLKKCLYEVGMKIPQL